eukprot:6199930-Pleurochrysis_carterae.AAC.2
MSNGPRRSLLHAIRHLPCTLFFSSIPFASIAPIHATVNSSSALEGTSVCKSYSNTIAVWASTRRRLDSSRPQSDRSWRWLCWCKQLVCTTHAPASRCVHRARSSTQVTMQLQFDLD